MKILSKITMIFILVFFTIAMTGCGNSSKDKEPNTIQDNLNINNNDNVRDLSFDQTPYSLRSSKVAKEIDKDFPGGILSPVGSGAFIAPLLQFHYINGRYPYDLKEFLYSGLCFIWPSNPLNGEPLKPVSDKLEPCQSDIGKIAYVRASDDEAYFEIVFYEIDDYIIYKYPNPEVSPDMINYYYDQEINPDRVDENDFFQVMRNICWGAFFRGEYWRVGNAPASIEEALVGNYYWIEENMAPHFISADREIPCFVECGLAYLDNKPVKFFEVTRELLEKRFKDRGLEGASNKKIISPVGSGSVLNADENWDRLTGKVYYYSTTKLLNGTLDLPESVLISRDEILGL